MNYRKKINEVIKEHISNNKKDYFIVALIFVIGIFLGVLFVNNMQEEQKNNISTYINEFIEKFKNIQKLNILELLKISIFQNVVLAIAIWFFGTTVIGIPVVFGVDLYRGFCLGYTISICIYSMEFSKGIVFVLISLLLQNIFFIPALLALSVSGFKLYKSIIKDKRKENIKVEFIRHTIFSILMLIVLLIASIIETFISTNLLLKLGDYF